MQTFWGHSEYIQKLIETPTHLIHTLLKNDENF